MLGIDIYERYQDVNDWGAVARHGIGFCWIKASDGGRTFRSDANRRPDALVAGARSVGIAAGLYHFAQKTPSPEAQADVLIGEVQRVGATGLPPALDLEDDPDRGLVWGTAEARDFGIRFCRRIVQRGYLPANYANSSMCARIRPDQWDVPGLVIWVADYGANNGQRNPDLRPYTGRADVHQYTSNGTVPGIAGRVDLNETITDAISGGGQEVDLTGEEHEWLRQIYDALSQPWVQNNHQWLGDLLATLGRYLPAETDSVTHAGGLAKVLEALVADVAELKRRPAADVDEAALAAELTARGIGGVTAAQLIDILSGVRLAPARPEGA